MAPESKSRQSEDAPRNSSRGEGAVNLQNRNADLGSVPEESPCLVGRDLEVPDFHLVFVLSRLVTVQTWRSLASSESQLHSQGPYFFTYDNFWFKVQSLNSFPLQKPQTSLLSYACLDLSFKELGL